MSQKEGQAQWSQVSMGSEQQRAMMAPMMVDHQIRQAINHCWMLLPEARKNPAELEKEMRRIFDRALKDFWEDAAAFGHPADE